MNILPEEWQAILKKSLSDTFQRDQIISGDERLRSLESAVQKNICTLHDLPPDDVVVPIRKLFFQGAFRSRGSPHFYARTNPASS